VNYTWHSRQNKKLLRKAQQEQKSIIRVDYDKEVEEMEREMFNSSVNAGENILIFIPQSYNSTTTLV
jgi:endo-alpha-1,4-polygalactosaminidase (GH114 family)